MDGFCADETRNGLIVWDVVHVFDGGARLGPSLEHVATLNKVLAAQGYGTMLLTGSIRKGSNGRSCAC